MLPLGTWRGAAKKPKNNRKQRKFSLKSGDNLSAEEGPFIEDRPIRISVELKNLGTDGVLVAQGGTAEGYSLYLMDGILTFVTRRGGKLAKLATSQKLTSDASTIVAILSKTGDVTLSVNGK